RYFGQNWQIGVNPLQSREPLWYPIADLVAAKVLSERSPKVPKVLRAVRFEAVGGRRRLADVDLLGSIPVDPGSQDFFQAVIEAPKRIDGDQSIPDAERDWRSKGLKILANATSYGIYAQMNRIELDLGQSETVTVHGRGDEPFRRPVSAPEEPGDYCFPPFAATITGAARLMLALLEHEVGSRGGTYAFCDTDSMAIVATETGEPAPCLGGPHHCHDNTPAVRALSWGHVEEIRSRFETLNPYNQEIVSDSILELEDENYADPKTRTERRQLYCHVI